MRSFLRHRRPGLVALVAAGLVLLGLQAPQATGETTSDVSPISLSSGQFQLTDTSYAAATDNLYDNVLTQHASLTDVITTNYTTNSDGDTDSWLNLRSMVSCPAADPGLPTVPTTEVWCWSPSHEDDTTTAWMPQGIATTGEADGSDGAIQGDRVVAVSWHEVNSDSSVTGCKANNLLKLTLIDRDTLQYRHVLLVVPTSTGSGATNYTYVTGHGGGIAWYAGYIFVTDTTHGIRVFDLNKMAKVDQYGSNVSTVGVNSGKSSACGYPYVVPEVHQYFQPSHTDTCSNGPVDPNYLCFSWLSLDKTNGSPYSLVTGEWYGSDNGGRIVRYQLNPASAATSPGLLATSGGKTVVQDAYTATHYDGLQGGMTWTDPTTGQLKFAFQKGCGTDPGVFSTTWVGDLRNTQTCYDSSKNPVGNWAAGPPEDVAYWPQIAPMTTDELWGLTEGPGIRTVYAVPFTGGAVQNLH